MKFVVLFICLWSFLGQGSSKAISTSYYSLAKSKAACAQKLLSLHFRAPSYSVVTGAQEFFSDGPIPFKIQGRRLKGKGTVEISFKEISSKELTPGIFNLLPAHKISCEFKKIQFRTTYSRLFCEGKTKLECAHNCLNGNFTDFNSGGRFKKSIRDVEKNFSQPSFFQYREGRKIMGAKFSFQRHSLGQNFYCQQEESLFPLPKQRRNETKAGSSSPH